jgi:TusA-related sulfurtransferase
VSACTPPAADLDLRGTPCPLNYIRTKLALERLAPGMRLMVALDRGEPEQLVQAGMVKAGHGVELMPHPHDRQAVLLLIDPCG